ncbi:MAG: 16S rRNA (uracil(1498)-N(3))-methyltransferase [Pseudomonadota bacterium]
MRRYWIPGDFFTESEAVLTGDHFHHICIVCRQGVGDRFELIHDGKAFFVEIIEQGKKKALAKILEERQIAELPKPLIHLALSLPKFQTLEKVLEKSVELGVHSLHPFTSNFSFAKPKAKDLEKKQQRWQRIIQGATQQTGRGDLMSLTEVTTLPVLLERFSKAQGAQGLLAFEGAGKMGLSEALVGATTQADELWLFIGSEGGFSEKDLELFSNYKLLPVSLGDQVLRVETACVTLVSVLKYGLRHFG